jgi:hypothetical protein
MKKKVPGKLALTRETLTDLHRTDLGAVAGGSLPTYLGCPTYPITFCVQPNTV